MALTLTTTGGTIQPPFNVPARAGSSVSAVKIQKWFNLYGIFASLPLTDRLAIAALVMTNYSTVQGGTDYRTNIAGLIGDAQVITDTGAIFDNDVGIPAIIWNSAKTLDVAVSSDIPTLLQSARALRALPAEQLKRIIVYIRLNCGF